MPGIQFQDFVLPATAPSSDRTPGGRSQRRCCLLAIGTVALAQVLGGAAWAQNCTTYTPGTAAAGSQADVNETGGVHTGANPIDVDGSGTNGCTGREGGPDHGVGGVGQTGGAGATFSATFTDTTSTISSNTQAGAEFFAVGGQGGLGGFSNQGQDSGGNGGPGGAGGSLTVKFDGTATNTNGPGLVASADGGGGGQGGKNNPNGDGTTERVAGKGGAGGAGGSLQFTMNSGTISSSGAFGGLALRLEANGGAGLDGGLAETSDLTLLAPTVGGAGGGGAAGGTVTATAGSGTTLTGLNAEVALVQANGGDGGNGGAARGANNAQSSAATGGAGAAGAQGGSATLTFSGTLNHGLTDDLPSIFWSGIIVESDGGSGGDGGSADGSFRTSGGEGADGAAGGAATLTFLGVLNQTDQRGTQTTPTFGTGLLVTSSGGMGGKGAKVDNFPLGGWGGNGGAAGAGGSATLNFGAAGTAAKIFTTTDGYNGAVVQSVGGGGGNGGDSTGLVHTGGGVGQGGGAGGSVVVNAQNGFLVTGGADASGLIAQSVGGGGGLGGNSTDRSIVVSESIGGNGGSGGNGGVVDVTIGPDMVIASTSAQGGGGVLAQSVGGNGGVGGSSNTQGASIFSLGIGGTGFSGGAADKVTVVSQGLVTTYGDHANGIQGQSVGGGGGDGGTALVFVGGVGSSAVAIGGSGGTGGTGQVAAISSSGQVSTMGPDSIGMQAQSVGGGGGNGGAATATALALSPHPDVPAVSVSVALGGSGGSGNSANAAAARNTGVVSTAGHGAIGVQVQSVGGGGGTGGDATASAYAFGRSDTNITVSTAVGGTGGQGGNAGGVQAYNDGLTFTIGQDATGLYGQSVGGGGGTGGAGDATSTTGQAANTMAVTISVGGRGGAGGLGNTVVANNTGTIATMGDGSDGVFTQSVGGGGGDGNGGIAAANGGTVAVAVGVGGNGGTGNHGGAASAQNEGVIVTTGSAAMGMVAQSVGGGGGTAGKGSTSLGGAASAISQAATMTTSLENNFGAGEHAVEVTKDVFKVAGDVQSAWNSPDAAYKLMTGANPPAPPAPPTVAKSVSIGVAVGGAGGAGGNGGVAAATNTGQIQTHGDLSDAVWVQSVGGGGGMGGATSTSQSKAATNSLNVGVGGGGGASGAGGAVTATNASGATVATFGDLSFGLAAQSVGGGGGRGGISSSSSQVLESLNVSLSGSGGANGAGGAVTIANAGSIATAGINAIGIFAQSVGGGGGLATVSTTDTGAGTGGAGPDTDTDIPVSLSFATAGKGPAGGAGGKIQVTSGGGITTAGSGATGIFAQSVGGGGGALSGSESTYLGDSDILSASDLASDGASGDGGDIRLDIGGGIATSGFVADAVWAASIGGGGGVMTSPGSIGRILRDPSTLGAGANRSGDGGDVVVNLTDAQISTSAESANGIAAWSFGGGGASDQSGLAGSLGGAGAGGDVTVSLTSSTVESNRGYGIYAYSDGGTGGSPAGNVSITIDKASRVAISTLAAIKAVSEGSITIANAGTIDGGRPGTDGAVNYSSPSAPTIMNTGTIIGGVYRVYRGPAALTAAAPTAAPTAAAPTAAAPAGINNLVGGVLTGADLYDLGPNGRLRNAGTVEVGEAGNPDTTQIVGDLVQTGEGILRFDLDSAGGAADYVTVDGAATLDGEFEVVPTTLLPGSHEVMAAGALTISESYEVSEGHIFSHRASVEGNRLTLAVAGADFTTDGADTDDRQSVARYLQSVWDAGGQGFATGFAALASVGAGDADAYAAALDTISGQSVAAIGYARYLGSQSFARSTYSCPRFEDASVVRTESTCGWFRVHGSWLERDASGDDPGFDFDAVTTSIGGQAEIGDGLFVGGALGWESSRLKDDADATTVDGDSYLGAISLKRETGPWTLTGALDLGWGSFDSSRQITLGTATSTATASPDAFNAGAHFRAAYEIPRGTWYAEPALDVDLAYVRLDSYTESGAGDFDLAVDETDTVVLTGTPWLKLGRRVDMEGGGLLDAYVSGGLSLSTGEDFDTTARLAGAPPGTGDFTTRLDNPNLVGRLSAGLEIYATDRIQLRLQYDGSFADDQATNAGQFRISYFF